MKVAIANLLSREWVIEIGHFTFLIPSSPSSIEGFGIERSPPFNLPESASQRS
jgi:hypothetical protein